MLSVIIPTVQKKLLVLNKLVKTLQQEDAISEIIVINNKPESEINFSEYSKVRVYTPEENLFVNPSWNLGVELAKCENFCLMNDDVLFFENFCTAVVQSPEFNDSQTGMVGIWGSAIKICEKADDIDQPVLNDEKFSPVFIDMGDRTLHTGDWGIAIFGKKQNYHIIPDRYKILYGDNWLLYKNLQNGKKNYAIYNATCNHIHSASAQSKEFERVVIDDILAADASEEFKGCNTFL